MSSRKTTRRFTACLDALQSHLKALAVFDHVITAKPTNPISSGLVASIMFDRVTPDPQSSGLNQTSAILEFKIILWRNQTSHPHFNVDRELTDATEAVIESFHEDLTLNHASKNGDGLVMSFGLLRSRGRGFHGETKNVQIDQGFLQTVQINVPLIVDDVWTQNKDKENRL